MLYARICAEEIDMAEAVLREHKRRADRWLPREKHFLPREKLRGAVELAIRCVPGFLLSFADIVGMPSGLHAAFGAALAALGRDVRPTLAGSGVAMMMRLISGLPPRWEMLITLMLLALSPYFLLGKNNLWLMGCTAVTLLPTAIRASLAATATEMIQGWGMLAVAALSAPVMVRAVKALESKRHIASMEERVSVGYLAAMCLCGGARLMLLGFNIGMLMGGCAVLAVALVLGVGAGTIAGMLAGVVLALQSLPLTGAVALSIGGFLAGISAGLSRRRLSCGCFAMGCYGTLLLSGGTGLGCGASVLAAAILVGVMPRSQWEGIQRFLRRFLQNDPASGDAYAAASLTAWEQTMAALARAVPSPKDAEGPRSGEWWQAHLCQGCPEFEQCGCMTTGLAITKAEAVWEYRYAQENIWQGAMEHLRGMGCQRLYFLLDAMNALRQEDESAQRVVRQAEAQRDMLITHLNAISGAARRFAMLSSGESWWDDMAARRIGKELAERAIPANLSYVRRVQGHAQAAFELQYITGARKQAEELCTLASVVLDAPMQLSSLDGDRVLLCELPLLRAEVGVAAEPISGGEVCGDTVWSGSLQDQRFLVALSDGMGHGQRAALSSRQTVELLRLCLDAGYTRQQTLTAVNGMMLLGGGGERFATADVLTIDLWKGQAALDKLGAAGSWLYQQGMLTRFTGDALPLGIIEEIDLSGNHLRLYEGDAVILLSDGVEDAFRNVGALENALLAALTQYSPGEAAKALLDAAFEADQQQRRDDQSAVFVYIRKNSRGMRSFTRTPK